MNIFILHTDISLCAQYHADKHVIKQIVEYAQLLSTAHRLNEGTPYFDTTKSGKRKVQRWVLPDIREEHLMKATHINHPCAIWARHSNETYVWLFRLWSELLGEYTHRYGKIHSCARLIPFLINPPEMAHTGWIAQPLAMPDECKRNTPVESYHEYYRRYKRPFATWKNRFIPPFMVVSK